MGRVSMNYVADTQSFVWYLTSDPKLSKKALKMFQETLQVGKVFIPSIVLAEILHISEKERITLGFKETLSVIKKAVNFEIYPLDEDVLLVASSIQGDRFDIHDRIIMATSLFLNAKLISSDKGIKDAGVVEVVF